MTWKDFVVIGGFYLLSYSAIKSYREDGALFNKWLIGAYLLLFVPVSELLRSYIGIQTFLECAFLYGALLVALNKKTVFQYFILTYGYLAVQYFYNDLGYTDLFVGFLLACWLCISLIELRKVKKGELPKDHQSFISYYAVQLIFLSNEDYNNLDHFFFFILFMGLFTVMFLSTAKIISFAPQEEEYVSGDGELSQVYEELKKKYPQYEELVDESLSFDDFVRYKLEKSYCSQDLALLKNKLSAGPEGIRKGAYGVLIWRLDDLGELNKA